MGLTTRKLQSQIVSTQTPHYFKVRNRDGENYCDCGSIADVETIINMNPGFTYEKIYLPHPPKTIDVSHIELDPDPRLSPQQILPDRQQEPLNL